MSRLLGWFIAGIGMLTVVATVLAVVLIGGAWNLGPPALPDPETADRDGLILWLVVGDLAEQPTETRHILARRIEAEFGAGLDWAQTAEQLDETQRARVWTNLRWLIGPWVVQKADGYWGLPAAERPAFLDGFLDMAETWRGAEQLLPVAIGEPDGAKESFLVTVYEELSLATQTAEPPQREQLEGFVAAVQARWLQRMFQGLPWGLPTGG